jgi:predicted DNA-binding protein (UPF0251 family)
MPRPHKCRRVAAEPLAAFFKPAGVPARALEWVELHLDELEALRLADLEALYHDVAAQRMNISRATFGRLLETARRKVAETLLNGKALEIQGGKVVIEMDRQFVCIECGRAVSAPRGVGRPETCPHCGKAALRRVDRPAGCGGAGAGRGKRSRVRGRRRGVAGAKSAPGSPLEDQE